VVSKGKNDVREWKKESGGGRRVGEKMEIIKKGALP
jgi:hypothetical protein